MRSTFFVLRVAVVAMALLLPACGDGDQSDNPILSDSGSDVSEAGDSSLDVSDAGHDAIDAKSDAKADAGHDVSPDVPDVSDATPDSVNDAKVDTLDAGPDVLDGACTQAPVALASAGNFAVLAGAAVTSTGPTSVTGDLGVFSGTAVTGFPPGVIIGAEHEGDTVAAQGIADLTTAYNDAAGRTLCPVTIAGNLGGQTLPPGLYKSTSSLEISSGDLTLDAGGDSSGVWIFQMASTLTTTAGRQVILAGNAKSTNVYWQVGSSATLGTTSAFQGTIMADQAITLETGATLNGRVLARIAAVSLDSNTIVLPSP